ncbi:MAG TPA: folylpolyglutamate synthase/dihydrofolate synthase family protein [Terracidiphilus sp.]|nr:folylpolyglutamate synthase/dihydrofolate synthase family protein [Terracidiphilus sp.]
MSYAEAITELNAMVPELHTLPGEPRRKFSLEEFGLLLTALGHPHRRFPSVLIAGTNGKGSTASALASILAASGLITGLYTSPHLTRPNERIRVSSPGNQNADNPDFQDISDEAFAALYAQVHAAAQQLIRAGTLARLPSFFETLTAMAFLHFAAGPVEVAVLEVGMGGRLDATNVVDPLLSIVTDISLDHTEWLGPTIADIAREKAGILRPGGTLVTLPQHPQANQALGEVATELGVRGVSAAPYIPPIGVAGHAVYSVEALGELIQLDPPLTGAHQQRNMALAIAAAVELALSHDFPITSQAIEHGINHVVWPGRLERITRLRRTQPGETDNWPSWVLDVAHNPAGAWALRAGLRGAWDDQGPQTLIFGCLRDKPVAELAQILFPLFHQVIFAPIHSPRAADLKDLLAAAEATGTPARAADSVPHALDLAEQATPFGRVVVSGSVYLVGEARPVVLSRAGRLP